MKSFRVFLCRPSHNEATLARYQDAFRGLVTRCPAFDCDDTVTVSWIKDTTSIPGIYAIVESHRQYNKTDVLPYLRGVAFAVTQLVAP